MGQNALRVNGSDIGASGRGVNVLEIDRAGNKQRTSNYDVYASPSSETNNLIDFINSAQTGNILLFAANDHAGNITDNGVVALEKLGSENIQDVQDGGRNNWAFICIKELGPLSETFASSGNGPVTTNHTLPNSMDIQNSGTIGADISEIGPAPESLVGWWKLDGDTRDYAGSNHTQVNAGSPSVTSGLGQSAYQFNEGSNGDQLKSDKLEGVDPDKITMSAWINPNTSSDSRSPIFRGGGDVYFQHYSNDRIATYWYGWNDSGYHYSSSGSVPTGEWSHVVVTWESTGEIKFYVNGFLDKKITGVGNGGGEPASKDALIGREGSNRRFNGKIQDVRIYDRALTREEVSVLYNLTNPRKKQQVTQNENGITMTKNQFNELL